MTSLRPGAIVFYVVASVIHWVYYTKLAAVRGDWGTRKTFLLTAYSGYSLAQAGARIVFRNAGAAPAAAHWRAHFAGKIFK